MSNYEKIFYTLIVIIIILFMVILTRNKDYNCSDFSTWEEAQSKFEKYDHDKYRLDGNNNNIACETLITN